MKRLKTLVFVLYWLTHIHCMDEVNFRINTKKANHVISERFISYTLNPTDLLQGLNYGLTSNSTINMIRALSPIYMRLGGSDTNRYTFKRNIDYNPDQEEFVITETDWDLLNKFAKTVGIDIIVALNNKHQPNGQWDSRNALELISFSDSRGYNLTWQLGYELQRSREEVSANQLGHDVGRLRTMLNAFPRYKHAMIVGPDMKTIHRKEDAEFYRDYFLEAGTYLEALTWHPRTVQSKFKTVDSSDQEKELFPDYLEWDKAQLNRLMARSFIRRPVWIAEPKVESKGTFLDALIWARRLGLASRIGVDVVMRQPDVTHLTHPKPEYWVALFHKKLLGRSVLDSRSALNQTGVLLFSHCTSTLLINDKKNKRLYDEGALSVFAVNLGSTTKKLVLRNGKMGLTGSEIHEYILTPDSRTTDAESILTDETYLNNEKLEMTSDGKLPKIKPRKLKKIDGVLSVKIPPYAIGFWVVPDAEIKACQAENIPTALTKTSDNEMTKIDQLLHDKLDLNNESKSRNTVNKIVSKESVAETADLEESVERKKRQALHDKDVKVKKGDLADSESLGVDTKTNKLKTKSTEPEVSKTRKRITKRLVQDRSSKKTKNENDADAIAANLVEAFVHELHEEAVAEEKKAKLKKESKKENNKETRKRKRENDVEKFQLFNGDSDETGKENKKKIQEDKIKAFIDNLWAKYQVEKKKTKTEKPKEEDGLNFDDFRRRRRQQNQHDINDGDTQNQPKEHPPKKSGKKVPDTESDVGLPVHKTDSKTQDNVKARIVAMNALKDERIAAMNALREERKNKTLQNSVSKTNHKKEDSKQNTAGKTEDEGMGDQISHSSKNKVSTTHEEHHDMDDKMATLKVDENENIAPGKNEMKIESAEEKKGVEKSEQENKAPTAVESNLKKKEDLDSLDDKQAHTTSETTTETISTPTSTTTTTTTLPPQITTTTTTTEEIISGEDTTEEPQIDRIITLHDIEQETSKVFSKSEQKKIKKDIENLSDAGKEQLLHKFDDLMKQYTALSSETMNDVRDDGFIQKIRKPGEDKLTPAVIRKIKNLLDDASERSKKRKNKEKGGKDTDGVEEVNLNDRSKRDVDCDSFEAVKNKIVQQKLDLKKEPTTDPGQMLKIAGKTIEIAIDRLFPEGGLVTRDNVKNLGISEYFNEFGKMVEEAKKLKSERSESHHREKRSISRLGEKRNSVSTKHKRRIRSVNSYDSLPRSYHFDHEHPAQAYTDQEDLVLRIPYRHLNRKLGSQNMFDPRELMRRLTDSNNHPTAFKEDNVPIYSVFREPAFTRKYWNDPHMMPRHDSYGPPKMMDDFEKEQYIAEMPRHHIEAAYRQQEEQLMQEFVNQRMKEDKLGQRRERLKKISKHNQADKADEPFEPIIFTDEDIKSKRNVEETSKYAPPIRQDYYPQEMSRYTADSSQQRLDYDKNPHDTFYDQDYLRKAARNEEVMRMKANSHTPYLMENENIPPPQKYYRSVPEYKEVEDCDECFDEIQKFLDERKNEEASVTNNESNHLFEVDDSQPKEQGLQNLEKEVLTDTKAEDEELMGTNDEHSRSKRSVKDATAKHDIDEEFLLDYKDLVELNKLIDLQEDNTANITSNRIIKQKQPRRLPKQKKELTREQKSYNLDKKLESSIGKLKAVRKSLDENNFSSKLGEKLAGTLKHVYNLMSDMVRRLSRNMGFDLEQQQTQPQ